MPSRPRDDGVAIGQPAVLNAAVDKGTERVKCTSDTDVAGPEPISGVPKHVVVFKGDAGASFAAAGVFDGTEDRTLSAGHAFRAPEGGVRVQTARQVDSWTGSERKRQ